MKDKKKRKKIVNYRRFAIVTVTFVMVAFALISGYFYFYLSGFSDSAVDLSKKDLTSKLNENDIEEIKENGKSCNILIMGVDIGTPGATNANDPKRTDTMILAHYNAEGKKVDLISIPRDILIKINGRNQKINAAHAIGGVSYTVNAVEELLGIQIDYYGKIDYEGFRQVIDAIGGLNMEITRRMDYDDSSQDLSIHFKKGTTVHLDGKKAEEFFRWRKNNDGTGFEDGDLGRIENQHMFIAKVMKKIKSPSIVTKIPSILSVIQNYVETNMDAKDILKYGYIFATIDSEKLSMDTVKGEAKYIAGVSYLVFDEAQNVQLISKLYDSNIQSIDKSKLKIKVVNGTKKVGLASDFSTYLGEKGYNKAVTENGIPTSKTKLLVCSSNEDIKTALKKDFKISNIEFSSSTQENFDIIVLLGEDHEYMH
jgi:LCP family protein required for cell wall assembly